MRARVHLVLRHFSLGMRRHTHARRLRGGLWIEAAQGSREELNMRQRRWLEYLVDYIFTMHYHPGKANVVVDALSRKNYARLASLLVHSQKIILDLCGILQARRQEFKQIRLFRLVALPALLS